MATSFTYDIYEGKPITFEQFLWKCVRYFCVAIDQRDDHLDVPVIFEKHLEKDSMYRYYKDRLKEAQDELAELDVITEKEAQRRATALYNEAVKKRDGYLKEALARTARFKEFYDKTLAWVPPTKEHENLKKFMLEQLSPDVKSEGDIHRMYPVPQPETAKEWIARKRTRALEEIEYYSGQQKKEILGLQERNGWIAKLAESVPYPFERKTT
jgi:site-specific recombinase XerD